MAAVLLKDRDNVAKIDGNHIGYANVPTTVGPPLTNVLAVDSVGRIFKQPVGGGGGGNLSAVLAAGNSGGCQSMTDIFGINGCPNFDFQITSVGTNADLILSSTAVDNVVVDAGTAILLNTDSTNTGLNTSIQMSAGNTVIQPSIPYPYSGNEIGVNIHNFFNTAGGGANQTGVNINQIASDGDTTGLAIEKVQTSLANSYGIRMDNINADQSSNGILCTNLNANNGDVKGVEVSLMNSTNGPAFGFLCKGPTANQNAYGLAIDGTNSTSVSQAFGVSVDNISSAGIATGISLNTITAPSAEGIIANGITGDTATGFAFNSVLANNGTANGGMIGGVIAPFGPASGMDISGVKGQGDAVGLRASTIESTASRGFGILTDSILSPVNQDAYGIDVINVKTTGTGATTGLALDQITHPSGNGRCYGINMTNVSGSGPTSGISMSGVTSLGASIAVGLRVSSTNCTAIPPAPAYGALLSRGTKPNNTVGRLVKVLDGLLSLNTQYLNNPVANVIQLDDGNLVLLGLAVPAPPAQVLIGNVGQPPEDGDWLLISKQGAGGHNIADANGNLINGAPVFNFAGGSDMVLMFFVGAINEWVAHDF